MHPHTFHVKRKCKHLHPTSSLWSKPIVSLWFDRLHILFPTSNLLFKLQQVSIGLSYLHSQNVIHGSIRGSNILIGNEGRAVLAEFGLTRLKVEVCTLAPTESSTPQNWMAPELFMGSPVSMKSDVYAFGLVIYEVCCSWTCLCLFRFSIILRWKVGQRNPIWKCTVIYGTKPSRCSASTA